MALLIYTNDFHSFFQHQSSLIFLLLTDPAFKNTVHHRWHRTTLYSTTHQLNHLKIYTAIIFVFFYGWSFFLWMSSTIPSIRHSRSVSMRVLHISLLLGLNNIHTNTCLPVLDQGWESISTSWFNFNSVTKCFEHSESGQTLNRELCLKPQGRSCALHATYRQGSHLDFSRHFKRLHKDFFLEIILKRDLTHHIRVTSSCRNNWLIILVILWLLYASSKPENPTFEIPGQWEPCIDICNV